MINVLKTNCGLIPTDGDKPRPPPEGDPMTMSMEGAEGDPAQMMAEAEEMLERPETIATTPVAPTHLRTMVDIHDSFRVCVK